MPKDIKQKFNDLSALTAVLDEWGDKAKDKIPKAAMPLLMLRVLASKAFLPKSKQYNVLNHSAYHNVLKNGPESVGYENACQIMERTLREGDKNTKLVLAFMSAKKAQAAMPQIENAAELRELAKEYKIGCFKKLLPK